MDYRNRQTGYVFGQNRGAHHKDPRRSIAQHRRVAESRAHGKDWQKATVFSRH